MANILGTIYFRPKTVANLRLGLFGRHIEEFVVLLMQQGYAALTLRGKIQWIKRWDRWLHKRTINIADIDETLITKFVKNLPLLCRRNGVRGTLYSFINYLREIGIVHTPVPSQKSKPLSFIEQEYEIYLNQERGLTPPVIQYHLFHVHRFLTECFGTGKIKLTKLCQDDIIKHILKHSSEYEQRSAQTWISALRCFIRYLNLCKLTNTDLTGCVLKTVDWNLSSLPKYIETDKVEKLRKSINRRTSTGLRDYALLLIIARLGLRGGEAAKLEFEDFDWQKGTLRVQGKNSRWSYLPIPEDVGKAIVEYIRKGRPVCSTRRVFVTAVAPYHEFKSSAVVSHIAANHLKRASIVTHRKGTHVLRHSLATEMLRKGGSLEEICQVLRHLHSSTTEIYAKVHFTALREIAQPWPKNLK